MKSGVYFLFLKKKVVYIGSTRRWPVRVGQHLKIEFDEAKLLECPYPEHVKYESRLIAIFKPVHNFRSAKKRVHRMNDQWLIDNKALIIDCYKKHKMKILYQKAELDLGYRDGSACETGIFCGFRRLFNLQYQGGEFRKIKKK